MGTLPALAAPLEVADAAAVAIAQHGLGGEKRLPVQRSEEGGDDRMVLMVEKAVDEGGVEAGDTAHLLQPLRAQLAADHLLRPGEVDLHRGRAEDPLPALLVLLDPRAVEQAGIGVEIEGGQADLVGAPMVDPGRDETIEVGVADRALHRLEIERSEIWPVGEQGGDEHLPHAVVDNFLGH